MRSAPATVEIRPYADRDEPEVLELLNAALGAGPAGSRPSAFFRWKHLDNPFGRSYMIVAETEGRIVGLRAFMRWTLERETGIFRAVRAVDTATHPAYQGQGIFSRLTRRALEDLREEADLVFNTPNAKSLPGYLKMGWKVVGRVPIRARVRRPVRFLTRARRWRDDAPRGDVRLTVDAPAAQDVLGDGGLSGLVAERERPGGISTSVSLEYLRWRYGAAPLLDYRALAERRDGRISGVAFFRVRPRGALAEATVSQVITAPGDIVTSRRLLRGVALAARVDHATCSFPPGSTPLNAARRAGFLPLPGGLLLAVNDLGHTLEPDPSRPRSWAPSLGDLEVF
jgi:GNAT superfamily N-acetyltransferase